jgi:hypothetical protein
MRATSARDWRGPGGAGAFARLDTTIAAIAALRRAASKSILSKVSDDAW